MTDRERAVSNDYYDIISDIVLPQGVVADPDDVTITHVGGDIRSVY